MQPGDGEAEAAGAEVAEVVSAAVDLGGLVGSQEPSVCTFPPGDDSLGREAVELASSAGLELDEWQQFVLVNALTRRPDGLWASFEVGVNVPRQNGKGGILEALELASLFLVENPLTIHSAHQFDTSLEAFLRLQYLIEDAPDLDRQVQRISRSHGEEGIELKGKRRVRFRTRTKGGGRGFSCDCLILDEAMFIAESAHGALLPTLRARKNPQVWYTGSAVDQEVHDHGIVFTRVRERGRKGDPRLAYFEWSGDPDVTLDMAEPYLDDERAWARANPGLGIRITREHTQNERRSMDPRTFAVELLGIGDWPDLNALDGQGIDIETWNERADSGSQPVDPVCFAFDVTPNRSASSICVAGRRADGKFHVEVVEHRPGAKWVVPRLIELLDEHECVEKPICDLRSPAAALLAQLEKAGVEVLTSNTQEHAQAAGMLFDAVEDDELRHLGTPELAAAVRGAVKRPLGDAWAWSRRASNVDISPLVGSTLALWGLETQQPAASEPLIAVT